MPDQVPHRPEIPVPGLVAAVDVPPPNAVEVNGSFSSFVAISSVVISPRVVV